MAFIEDQQTNFKHFCRICKKGFMCGRALGGHMRAHGIGDENANIDDEDPGSDWEDRGNIPANKHMYALRTNPNRLKSCRACENCGKEFISWKSFLEHGKCNSDDAGFLLSSPPSSDGGEEQKRCQWSKRKRTMRAKVGGFPYPWSEEEDFAATCLMMLANARVDPVGPDDTEESCASASKEDETPRRNNNIALYVSPLYSVLPTYRQSSYLDMAKGVAKGVFECKACKKVFNSHQALGGHRASHKKVKGCFAARLDLTGESMPEDDVIMNDELMLTPNTTLLNFHPSGSSRRKPKVHECTICNRVFSSGQALGGHKRCHWFTSNLPESSSLAKFNQLEDQMDQIQHQRQKFSKSDTLDLNFPAPGNDLAGIRRDPKNPLSFEVSTEINLLTWPENNNNDNNDNDKHIIEKINNDNDANKDNNVINDENTLIQDVDDEADSKVKLAKLSEIKDMNVSNNLSSWLQVGIGPTANVGSDA